MITIKLNYGVGSYRDLPDQNVLMASKFLLHQNVQTGILRTYILEPCQKFKLCYVKYFL